MPANHPDPDTLADLTADVLPPDLARAVESHVMGCANCAAVLDGAERVRGLLVQTDPGPMPDQVWDRLEQAFLTEAQSGGQTTGLQTRVPGGTTGIMRPVAGGQTGLQDAVRGERSAERTQVLHRPGRIPQPTRRQARKDNRGPERTDAPSRSARLPLILVAAAALVAVGTVGTFLVKNMDNHDSADSVAANISTGAQAERNVVTGLTPVYGTNTAYTSAQLAQQVNALLAKPPKPVPVASPAPSGASRAADTAGGGAVEGNSALADPKALAGCLTALDAPPASRPLAVDFGSYNGQEAAVIVLPAREQGYEVWIVARTCSPADDGTIDYKVIKPQ